MFEVPVVLFIFKRDSGLEKIINQIKKVAPKKMYLIADGPRTEAEKVQCEKCRKIAESLIDWDCELVKDYANENRGVLKNIGLGAKRVLKKEKWAIFLEDDNLPELTFFDYCKELLHRYEKNDKILWICGTNYLGHYDSEYSYMFTQHLLPCGWASWSEKYIKYYDGFLNTISNQSKWDIFKQSYYNKALLHQQTYSIKQTKYLLDTNINRCSWDYQMLFSLRSNAMYGISPCNNQIKNIGADEFSTHGGSNINNVVVNRFCGMQSFPLQFPLKHPQEVKIDMRYESLIGKIIQMPIKYRIYRVGASILKKILGLNPYQSFKEFLKKGEK